MPTRFRLLLAVCVPFAFSAGCGSGDDGHTTGGQDPEVYLAAPKSCAYDCPDLDCPETTTPYTCPALGAWPDIPHMPECPAWNGKTPAVVAGKCTATEPAGEAVQRPGPNVSGPGTLRLPDGRSTKPAGKEWVFNETDIDGGTTVSVAAVPGTPFVLTVDTGNHDHAVRAVDTTKIGISNPVTAMVKFSPPSYLNSGIAVVAPSRAYVATDYGVVQALSFDAATGALARDDAASLPLPSPGGVPFYAAGVAASPDGTILVVSAVEERTLLVFDIDPGSPTYMQQLGTVDIGERETFNVYFDPNDPAGLHAYVSIWGNRKVLEIDLADPQAPAVTRTFATDSNPQGIAFLDGRWMVVGNDYGETISLVDRTSGMVTSLPVDFEPGHKGLDVSGAAYDAISRRLYVTLAGINAIGVYDVDLAPATPALTPVGRLPTSWWPSGMVVHPDGALTVVNMRGGPIGPFLESHPIGGGHGDNQMRGSVQQILLPAAADLTAGEAQVAQTIAVGSQSGYPSLDCPAGVADFPLPPVNDAGPSPVIDHVFFIVRENKTFDALLGDLPTVEGDPQYAMKDTPEKMDRVWLNFRDLARTFSISDNFYNLAVKSTQGHQWTTYGRTTDFCERTWSSDSRKVPLCGIGNVGRPDEGSLFEWLQKNGVVYDILGEIVGNPAALPPGGRNPIDVKYPGGPFQNIDYNDLEKACYTAARARVACNLGHFVYMTLPNDHTVGASPDNPSPEVMCAVNDEATGMFIDALSHSPLWASSLVIVTEDDPQQGGDHIDYHRTPLLLVSPWVKRGYVSKTHIDVASLHKIFAHILGLPYPNVGVKNAGLPLDIFTSTPDYTPYTYKPRVWPLECGKEATRSERILTESWDFREVDNQPGLGDQVMRWMRGRQLSEIPKDLQAQIDARNARRARGLPPLREEDDDD